MNKLYSTDKLFREREVADLLGVSESWLQKGRVYKYGPPFIKLRGGRGGVRYRYPDVIQWIETNRSDEEPS